MPPLKKTVGVYDLCYAKVPFPKFFYSTGNHSKPKKQQPFSGTHNL